MEIKEVYIGGWFQRTTLHLTEMYDFLKKGESGLDFPKEELKKLQKGLGLVHVERQNWMLEYIDARTALIDMKLYEDGLMVLRQRMGKDVKKVFDTMEKYYNEFLSPAISYIFSKGAPVPKELAHMQTLLPFVVVAKSASEAEVKEFFKKEGMDIYSEAHTLQVRVYKSPRIILIVSKGNEEQIRQLVEGQLFFREFKSQLHKYLGLHRAIWEEIALIKERGKIKGTEIKGLRSKLDDYQKTIKLIESRINQMSTYLRTRGKLYSSQKMDDVLDKAFAYKFETLEDTLAYVKELWKMTDNYLSSAIGRFQELQTETTKNSITSLRLVTTLGVVAGIIGYLGRESLPEVTLMGWLFFVVLLVITWLFNEAVSSYYARKSYMMRKEKLGF